MPRQNRVTPSGELVANAARGRWMGNRGRLHDAAGRLGRARWRTRAWIICRLEFKGRRREIMAPGRYTELFFLDEATALAAGHRPCGECRRADFEAFRRAWLRGNPGAEPAAAAGIRAIDAVLHAERLRPDGAKRTWAAELAELPGGAMLLEAGVDGPPLLWWDGRLWPWTPSGYAAPRRLQDGPVEVLTPASTCRALAAGYPVEVALGPASP